MCFPNWDSLGHCRQFDVIVARDGVLRFIVEWSGAPRGIYNSELFLIAPDDSWEYAPDEWPEKRVSRRVQSGVTYNLVLISYGPFPDRFKLRSELRE